MLELSGDWTFTMKRVCLSVDSVDIVCFFSSVRVPVGSPSRGRDVTVYDFFSKMSQPSLHTPFYSVLVSISLLRPFQLYSIP